MPKTYTREDFARAFTEWDRRYREEPERFMSEAQHLLNETPETYGEYCAPYFVAILDELSGVPAAPPASPALATK